MNAEFNLLMEYSKYDKNKEKINYRNWGTILSDGVSIDI